MKVKMLSNYAGPKGAFPAGRVVEFEAAEGKKLVDLGYACLPDATEDEKQAALKKQAAHKVKVEAEVKAQYAGLTPPAPQPTGAAA